ncbi:hypothetical protein BGZ70_002391 [Mortierella alpina]|uniref:Nuclear fusion protein KAR5 n=1 Tax=Mortierella alpina TaxID=64518 RepID=A0A9P6JBT4_MORAP|nr:hypothetical protein BGZ70_002391 [Mortierella alpina]
MQHAADALSAYDHKSQCFKEAARALKQGCKSIDMDEDEKTRYAIRLTACEIATANMPVPVECREIGSYHQQRDSTRTTFDIGRCVQLRRVTQLWTSYSGYFREVKTMCLAARYSMQQEELRHLQKNLSRSHADQIALLQDHRRELLHAHQLQSERLQELMQLHSTVATELSTILTSAGALRHSLNTVFDDISKLIKHSEQGAVQQRIALSTMQDANDQLLADYQANMQETIETVSRTVLQWHGLSQAGISQAQELDRRSKELMSQILLSETGLSKVTLQINQAEASLTDLVRAGQHGATQVLDLQDSSYRRMNDSAKTAISNMLQSIKAMETTTLDAWHNMSTSIKIEGARLRSDLSEALVSATSDIESMSSESLEKLVKLSSLLATLESKQASVFQGLRTIRSAWVFLPRVLWAGMSSAGATLPFVTFVGLAFVSGLKAAMLLLLAATMVTAGCSHILPPVPLGRVLLILICLQTMRRTLERLRFLRRSQDQQQCFVRLPEPTETVWEYYSDEEHGDEWEWADNEAEPAGSLASYMSSNVLRDENDLAYPLYSHGLGMSLGLCTQSYSSLAFDA